MAERVVAVPLGQGRPASPDAQVAVRRSKSSRGWGKVRYVYLYHMYGSLPRNDPTLALITPTISLRRNLAPHLSFVAFAPLVWLEFSGVRDTDLLMGPSINGACTRLRMEYIDNHYPYATWDRQVRISDMMLVTKYNVRSTVLSTSMTSANQNCDQLNLARFAISIDMTKGFRGLRLTELPMRTDTLYTEYVALRMNPSYAMEPITLDPGAIGQFNLVARSRSLGQGHHTIPNASSYNVMSTYVPYARPLYNVQYLRGKRETPLTPPLAKTSRAREMTENPRGDVDITAKSYTIPIEFVQLPIIRTVDLAIPRFPSVVRNENCLHPFLTDSGHSGDDTAVPRFIPRISHALFFGASFVRRKFPTSSGTTPTPTFFFLKRNKLLGMTVKPQTCI
ncbi:hypothetical protein ACRALDRAFT_209953 [Sodiomyces alcalophilus JCM 7366]|uniref:uncharacterized protein n=1 Tax=Sodiomyces alcalophilus JCM 7366 TaxID=591952 RepID=UPI0039B3ADBC